MFAHTFSILHATLLCFLSLPRACLQLSHFFFLHSFPPDIIKNITIIRMTIISEVVASFVIVILTTRVIIYAPKVINYAPREHL
jgi:hypothetical protein